MTAARLIPLPIHAAVELMTGLLLMAAPFALGLSAAAMLTGVVLGALVAGLAIQSVDTGADRPLPVSAHHAFDYGLAVGLAGAAAVFAPQDPRGAALFGAAALFQVALSLVTRYTQR